MKYTRIIRDFIYYTGKDFQKVWEENPNVLIWCSVMGAVLLLI